MEWQHTPVFLPGEFHGQKNLIGYSPCGHKESDMNECMKYTPTCVFPVREEKKQHSKGN